MKTQQAERRATDIVDLVVEDLRVSGPDHEIVHGISFSVRRGEMLAIAGESGSGKSVSCLAAIRLLPDNLKTSGSVVFRGANVLEMSEAELRAFHATAARVVFQDPWSALNPMMTIGQQLEESALSAGSRNRAAARSAAIEALELVNVSDPERRMAQRPRALSGGLLQRVVIAMALIGNPSLLICDEPTTALDASTETQVMDLLLELNRKLGTSVILTTHDLGLIGDYCDRVAVMYAGRLVETGPVADTFSNPRHPYTRALLGAMPGTAHVPPFSDLATIDGQPPAPGARIAGCAFAPRCPSAFDRCRKERPPLRAVAGADEAGAACWLSEV
ncbi:ABC transporter ATP-binding protein [Martelella sp. HB161492]|uniref:ABC transporter ATP-binding protein n=1 Tax=Martelella sp. HB161492 TaxID=2720726 RepID=UPI0015910728|nr:ABC transporter ATP-binding protein [Martelella sp. HB161492]